jgi:hypothetical protein
MQLFIFFVSVKNIAYKQNLYWALFLTITNEWTIMAVNEKFSVNMGYKCNKDKKMLPEAFLYFKNYKHPGWLKFSG